jgi:putative cell wall-binding protein
MRRSVRRSFIACALLTSFTAAVVPAGARVAVARMAPPAPASIVPRGAAAEPDAAAATTVPSCAGWTDIFRPPGTILVGHVIDGAVASVVRQDFRAWVGQALTRLVASAGVTSASTDEVAAIEAAAIVVKQYGWHRTLNHREVGYSLAAGNCYDVRDDDRDLRLAATGDPADPLTAEIAAAITATWRMTLRRPDLPDGFFLSRPSPGDSRGCAAIDPKDHLHVELPLRNAVVCAKAGASRRAILERYLGPAVRAVDAVELAGADRYATSVAVSKTVIPTPKAPIVYVASGAAFPDALVAGPAAAAVGGVVLLVAPSTLPASVDAELVRLKPSEIRVVGGPAAVSDAVVTALRTRAPVVRRISGTDRYRTALAVTSLAFPAKVDTVFVATGRTYPDALSAGSAAAATGSPLLLVSDPLDPGLRAALAAAIGRLAPTTIQVVGGPAAVPASTVDWLATLSPAVTRLAGADRYATSAAVSAAIRTPTDGRVAIATGENFPDALVAAPLGDPLLLVPGTAALPGSATVTELTRLAGSGIAVLGTSRVVRDRVVATLVGAKPATSGVQLPAYFNEAPASVSGFDKAGIPMVLYNGALEYNPVTIAQFGLARHADWVGTHDPAALAGVVKMADWLLANQTVDGRWLYTFAFGPEPVPWWSGMAQGQGISLLLRAYQATDDARYLAGARLAFVALARPTTDRGTTLIDRGDTWIEEYLPPYSTHTLNGFLFALEGVRELTLVTGDSKPLALYRASIKTLHDFIPDFDTGTWSYYNLGGSVSGGRHVANLNYHLVHILQLRHFALIENDLRVAAYAARFASEVTGSITRAADRGQVGGPVTPLDVP